MHFNINSQVSPANYKPQQSFKKTNIDITSLNINGIKTKLDDHEFCNFILSNSITLLQETWHSNDDFICLLKNVFTNHTIYSSCAECINTRGRFSGGLISFINKK